MLRVRIVKVGIGFFMHFVVMCNGRASFAAAKYVAYIEGCTTSVIFALKVRAGNIITRALKITEFCSR